MKWTRPEPGHYTAGPYVVKRWNCAKESGTTWHVDGPGIDGTGWHRTKEEAGAVAEDAMAHRLADGGGATVPPVRGDRARLRDTGRAGFITSVFPGDNGHPLYCIRLPRNRRVCVHREEFEVIEP